MGGYRKGIPKINVGRYAGTPIDQLPNSYLRWMLGQDFPKEWLEVAKRKLDASPYSDEYLTVSRHAYDQFSLRFLDMFVAYLHTPQVKHDGIGTFLVKQAQEAWDNGQDVSKRRHRDDGTVKLLRGIKWVFGTNAAFPDYKELITVMPADDTE